MESRNRALAPEQEAGPGGGAQLKLRGIIVIIPLHMGNLISLQIMPNSLNSTQTAQTHIVALYNTHSVLLHTKKTIEKVHTKPTTKKKPKKKTNNNGSGTNSDCTENVLLYFLTPNLVISFLFFQKKSLPVSNEVFGVRLVLWASRDIIGLNGPARAVSEAGRDQFASTAAAAEPAEEEAGPARAIEPGFVFGGVEAVAMRDLGR